MILRRLYLGIFYLVMTLLALFGIVLLALHHPRALPLASEYLKTRTPLKFDTLEGTLANGVIFNNISYENLFSARKITLRYSLIRLLQGHLQLNLLKIEDAAIDLRDLPSSESAKEETALPPMPSVLLEKLMLRNVQIRSGVDLNLSLDATALRYAGNVLHVNTLRNAALRVGTDPEMRLKLSAETIRFDGTLDAKTVQAGIDYGNDHADLNGSISRNSLMGDALVTYDPKWAAALEPHVASLPSSLPLHITRADTEGIDLQTHLATLHNRESNTTLRSVVLNLKWRYDEKYLSLQTGHLLEHPMLEARLEHDVRVGFDGAVHDAIGVRMLKSRQPLWFDVFSATLDANTSALTLALEAPNLKMRLESDDFSRFEVSALLFGLDPGFVPNLPPYLRRDPVSARVDATLDVPSQKLRGNFEASTVHTQLGGSIEASEGRLLSEGNITTDGASEFWKSLPLRKIDTLHWVASYATEQSMLYLTSELLHVTLFQKAEQIGGWGSVASANFDVNGTYDANATLLQLHSHIPSLYTLADSIVPIAYPIDTFYDAGVDLNATLRLDQQLHISTDTAIEWYLVQRDRESIFYGTNAALAFDYEAQKLRLNSYRFNVDSHDVFATRPGMLRFDENGSVTVETLWVNDAIRVSGDYDMGEKALDLRIQSDDFHYNAEEGDLNAALDLTLHHENNATALEGEVHIKKAQIRYKPMGSHHVEDDDIIVIQEVKAPQSTPLSLNVRIVSDAPLQYKTSQADLFFITDVTLWKEPLGSLELLGWVQAQEGWVYASGSEFAIEPSDVYFAGGARINPYLNLHLFYEVDAKEIDIYATHTLNAPVFLFTSNPSMSQTDIMSYILFGTAANESFESDESSSNRINAANMILGTGMKELIGDTTGLRIDTLNLLSKKDGGVGFEVGTRLSRDLRVVLKNDNIFSVVLQLSLSKTLRIDVDVEETGQGINLIYIKDYADPFKGDANQNDATLTHAK